MAGTYEIPEEGSPNASQDPKIKTMLKGLNEALDTSNKTPSASLSLGNLGRLYAPTIIATEQARENVAFGTLTTPDEVKSVVVPENGLVQVGYIAKAKSSISTNGRVAIFIGSNQLTITTSGLVQEVELGTEFANVGTAGPGLVGAAGTTAFKTTGQPLAVSPTGSGGFCSIFGLPAGTYNVSVQFKATSGTVTAKERKLWVGVIGGV